MARIGAFDQDLSHLAWFDETGVVEGWFDDGLIGAAVLGIAFDAASNSGYQAVSASYSWNHTCAGSDRYLVVGVSMLSLAQTVSGITYNSVAMTFLGSQNSMAGAARVEMWGLIAPTVGTNLIAVTLTGAIASAGNASSYTGVKQASPTEGWNSAQATNVGAADATVNITTVADKDWVVDILATDDGAVTVGAGQTQTGNVTGAGGSGAMSYEGPKTPAGSVTMSWANVGALATWAIGGVALRPSGVPTTYNETLAATVALADDYASTHFTGGTTYNSSLAEAIATADGYVSGQVFVSARTESVALDATQGGTAVYPASRSESVALADSLSTGVIFAPTLAEALALADSVGATHTMLSVYAESVALAVLQEGSLTGLVWPAPADVREGVMYGPTGTEYTGTLKATTTFLRRR